MRFEDEFVRHKILDAIGDLALVGYPVIGHLVAHRAGHALHTEFAAKILEETHAWRLVEAPLDPASLPVVAAVKIAAPAWRTDAAQSDCSVTQSFLTVVSEPQCSNQSTPSLTRSNFNR